MYKVKVTYHFKNDMMYSLFQSAILYVVEGKKYDVASQTKGLSKLKRKLVEGFIRTFITDFEYLIDQGYGKYEMQPDMEKKGGRVYLDIDFPLKEHATYMTYVNMRKDISLVAEGLKYFMEIDIKTGTQLIEGDKD